MFRSRIFMYMYILYMYNIMLYYPRWVLIMTRLPQYFTYSSPQHPLCYNSLFNYPSPDRYRLGGVFSVCRCWSLSKPVSVSVPLQSAVCASLLTWLIVDISHQEGHVSLSYRPPATFPRLVQRGICQEHNGFTADVDWRRLPTAISHRNIATRPENRPTLRSVVTTYVTCVA